jgi:hypothetical protein
MRAIQAEASDVDQKEKTVLSLHDSISLGEVEQGLSTGPTPLAEEMHRLPTLLRLLSSARSLANIPKFDLEKLEKEKADKEQDDDAADDADELMDEAVRRLEDRAAIYSVAEGVEVVSCHLAPVMCRTISRLRPLKKDSKSRFYETEQLLLASCAVAQAPPLPSKRRKLDGVAAEDDDDDLHHQSEDEMSEDDADLANDDTKKRRRGSMDHPTLSSLHHSEDSQEANISRILTELTSLVVQSLKIPKEEEEEGARCATVDWSISMEDSILAEARQSKALLDNVGGAMVGSDLGATVVSLLHHTPVLRHDHVAVSPRSSIRFVLILAFADLTHCCLCLSLD